MRVVSHHQPRRVVIVVHGLDGGGVARVIAWLADRLVQHGNHVTLVARTPVERDAHPLDHRVNVVRVRPPRITRLAPPPLRRTLERVWLAHGARRAARGADVCISFITETNLAVILAMLGRRTPVIVAETSHPFARADELRPLVQRLRPWLYRRAAVVVVLTDEIAQRARHEWHLTTVNVISNPAPTIAAEMRVPPLGDRPRQVLAVGKLRAVKDHRTLIEAWARSSARHHGWRLTIVGEGPLRAELQSLICDLGVADTMSLPGATEAVSAHYLTSRIFVHSSRVEGAPNVVLEALAHGCACIVTDCPGAPAEMVGDAGLVVPVGDAEALARALDELVNDPARCDQLAGRGAERLAPYQPDVIFEAWRRTLDHAVR